MRADRGDERAHPVVLGLGKQFSFESRSDGLFPGDNDYSAEQAGLISIRVQVLHETKRENEACIACFDSAGQHELKTVFEDARGGAVKDIR